MTVSRLGFSTLHPSLNPFRRKTYPSHIDVCTDPHTDAYIPVYMNTHTTETHILVHVSLHCVCVACVYMYIHIHCEHMQINKYIYTHMQILSHIHAHAHNRHIETQIFKCTQIYTERFIRICTSTYTNGCFHLAEVPCTHQRPRLNTSRRGTLIWNIGESATNQYCHTGCDEREA